MLLNAIELIEKLDRSSIELGLERIAAVFQKFKTQKLARQVITIAGTNGKGTTVSVLEAILLQAGFRVGAFTSPHLCCVTERIRVNGEKTSTLSWSQAYAKVLKLGGSIRLSYFEFLTLMAFWMFQQQDLDFVLLEVGLGGRLDAVNVMDADLAVITNIDIDHVHFLGKTRDVIGFEKAGIFRSNTQAVFGGFNIPKSILKRAEDLQVKLYCRDRDFQINERSHTWDFISKENTYSALPIPKIPLDNAGTALMALQCFGQFKISEKCIQQALKTVCLRGRFERLNWRGVEIILDVAHNPHAANWLAKKLNTALLGEKCYAVFGVFKDKDFKGMIKALESQVEKWFLVGLESERGLMPSVIAEQVTARGGACAVYESFKAGLQAVWPFAVKTKKPILIFGSFKMVEAAIKQFEGK